MKAHRIRFAWIPTRLWVHGTFDIVPVGWRWLQKTVETRFGNHSKWLALAAMQMPGYLDGRCLIPVVVDLTQPEEPVPDIETPEADPWEGWERNVAQFGWAYWDSKRPWGSPPIPAPLVRAEIVGYADGRPFFCTGEVLGAREQMVNWLRAQDSDPKPGFHVIYNDLVIRVKA